MAPPATCFMQSSFEVKMPVDSSTKSTPRSPHGNSAGSFFANILISLPLTTMASSFAWTDPSKGPYVLSYLSKCASVFASVKSFMAATSNADSFRSTLNTLRPIRPNPLIPIFIAMVHFLSPTASTSPAAVRETPRARRHLRHETPLAWIGIEKSRR